VDNNHAGSATTKKPRQGVGQPEKPILARDGKRLPSRQCSTGACRNNEHGQGGFPQDGLGISII